MTTRENVPDPAVDPQAGWRDRWAELEVPDAGLGAELVSRYAEETRKYHDLDHLTAVLDAVTLLAAEALEPGAVRLAAWFHDAIYDVRRDDNEEQSAELATLRLGAAGVEPATVSEVARLVRLTRTHDPAPGDANGTVLSDADLAVLASSPGDYDDYTCKVRAEYAHVSTPDFREGRAAILEQLLALPALYGTRYGRSHWEQLARTNLQRELVRLSATPDTAG